MEETRDMSFEDAWRLAFVILESRPEWKILSVKVKSPYDASGDGYVVETFHTADNIRLTVAESPELGSDVGRWLDEIVSHHTSMRERGFSHEAR